MARIPYLVRRINVFYFRLVIPADLRGPINAREIIRSLKTESRYEAIHQALKLAAHYKAVLHDLRTGKASRVSHLVLPNLDSASSETLPITPLAQIKSSTPLLSVVITDFLKPFTPLCFPNIPPPSTPCAQTPLLTVTSARLAISGLRHE
jgi:hypothetical protein